MSLPTHKPVDTMKRRDTTTRKKRQHSKRGNSCQLPVTTTRITPQLAIKSYLTHTC